MRLDETAEMAWNPSMLTKQQIQALGIIQDADADSWDDSNYNLRVGAEYVQVNAKPEVGNCSKIGIVIPPFGCVLVGTHEWVRIPANVYGRWGLRIRPALSGLIFQAGPQIEPGYKGRLFGLLFNLSTTEHRLACLKDIWSIDFTQIGEGEIQPLPAGDPLPKHMQITGFLTEQIPTGGLADALEEFGRRNTELQELRKSLIDRADTLDRKYNEKLKELDDTAKKDEERVKLAEVTAQAEREKERRAELQSVHKRLEERENMLREMLSEVKSKKEFVLVVIVGVVVVLAAAILPLVISKTVYDRDIIVAIKDDADKTAHRLAGYEAKIEIENAANEKKQIELQAKLTEALIKLDALQKATNKKGTAPEQSSNGAPFSSPSPSTPADSPPTTAAPATSPIAEQQSPPSKLNSQSASAPK